jgi:hypothetical protein
MDWGTLRGTLEAACEGPLTDEVAGHAVEAAEIVASAAGEPPDELSYAAREWVETHGIPEDDLIELACRAMKCVAGASPEWHERLNDLRFRLGDVAAA